MNTFAFQLTVKTVNPKIVNFIRNGFEALPTVADSETLTEIREFPGKVVIRSNNCVALTHTVQTLVGLDQTVYGLMTYEVLNIHRLVNVLTGQIKDWD
jgi:hypothetical protein